MLENYTHTHATRRQRRMYVYYLRVEKTISCPHATRVNRWITFFRDLTRPRPCVRSWAHDQTSAFATSRRKVQNERGEGGGARRVRPRKETSRRMRESRKMERTKWIKPTTTKKTKKKKQAGESEKVPFSSVRWKGTKKLRCGAAYAPSGHHYMVISASPSLRFILASRCPHLFLTYLSPTRSNLPDLTFNERLFFFFFSPSHSRLLSWCILPYSLPELDSRAPSLVLHLSYFYILFFFFMSVSVARDG